MGNRVDGNVRVVSPQGNNQDVGQAFQALLAGLTHIQRGGNPQEALMAALGLMQQNPSFGLPPGRMQMTAQVLDGLIQSKAFAPLWGKLGQYVASPEAQKAIVQGLTSVLGDKAGRIIGNFGNDLLKNLTGSGGGFRKALDFMGDASKGAAVDVVKKLGGQKGLGKLFGGLSKLLGKVGKLIPFVGLAIGIINAIKVFTQKPPATPLQKLNALVGVAAGAAAIIPGIGTGVSAALNTASLALSGLDIASSFLKGKGSGAGSGAPNNDAFDLNNLFKMDLGGVPDRNCWLPPDIQADPNDPTQQELNRQIQLNRTVIS